MTAIEFNHVGKQYRLGLVSTGTISHDLNRWWQTAILRKEDPYLKIGSVNDRTQKADSDYVWALRDIDFKVEQGDVVGIIGKNGAGKSTLLKLLSKVTAPTVGTIRARGRIASLLEVGTGFHGEMTGRENIYLNGAILGMTKQEITAKLDEIVDFSGCERYLDTPVKRYSSGMTVRLGFAVAAFLDPEILVVDEVLAVGDAEFQKKAIGKMQDVSRGEGRTVLFVSHNMASIRQLCTSGVLLENGMVKKIGSTAEVVDYYMSNGAAVMGDVPMLDGAILEHYRLNDGSSRQMLITKIERLTPYHIDSLDSVTFRVHVKNLDKNLKTVQLTTLVDDVRTDQRVGLTCSQPIDITGKDEFVIEVTLNNMNLTPGAYRMNFWVGQGDITSSWHLFDCIYNSLTFEVDSYDQKMVKYWAKDWGFNYFGNCSTILK